MILGIVQIQNFKSIHDTGPVYLSKGDLVTILAGQNESGKTSFLRALRFFEEGAYESFEEEDRRMDEFPRVDCTFYLTASEYEQLKNDTNTAIADYIKKNGFTFVRGDVDEDDFEKIKWINPAGLESLVVAYHESLNATEEGEEETGEVDSSEVEEVEEFSPIKYFRKMRPTMVFYSTFDNSNLPGKADKTEVETSQAIKDFETVYNIDFADLMSEETSDQKRASEEKRVEREAAESLNLYWNQVIANEQVEYEYNIKINFQEAAPLNSTVNFFISQGEEKPLRISQKSQGFQWFSGFNLRLRAHEAALDSKGLILLIDEPGQGLHEIAQQDVKNVIEELARDAGIQIIYSTHQPILLGKEDVDFSRLLLVDRDENGSRFKTISALVTSNGSLDSLAPIKSALGMVTLTDPFSDKVTLIVEGITEYFYLKYILGDKYNFIPSAGVDQCPNIFAILYGWGVPAKVLVDDDTQGTKAANKIRRSFFNDIDDDLYKKTLLKPVGKKGIEDFLSRAIVNSILEDYGKDFLENKSMVENVEQVGKFIFAKHFNDMCHQKEDFLDDETKANFKEIEDFLES